MEIFKSLIKLDNIFDYIPVASTVTNLVDLFEKLAFRGAAGGMSTQERENKYVKHIREKSAIRCAILLIPVLGNVVVAVGDLRKGHKTESLTAEDFERRLLNGEDFGDRAISVIGDLNLSDRTDLITLPAKLYVHGNLVLIGCTSLMRLPRGLVVNGCLDLYGCTSLTELPADIHVGGYLNLSGCTNLSMLQPGIRVDGDLFLRECPSLTSLPSDLDVGGEIELLNCPNLIAIPDGLPISFQINRGPMGGQGASFGDLGSQNHSRFQTVDEALDFWMSLLPKSQEPLSINIDFQNPNDICSYLDRLRKTQDFINGNMRPLLALRVVNLFKNMSEDEELKELACEIIADGLTTCGDRVSQSMDDLEIMLKVRLAERSGSKDELRALGKGLLMLEKVKEKALAHARNLAGGQPEDRYDEELEIIMAYKIVLKERLNLPIFSSDMLYRACARVTDTKIKNDGKEIESQVTEEAVNKFLVNWDPWKKHLRRESFPEYKKIKQVNEFLKTSLCSITQEETKKPVLYGGNLYKYSCFKRIYVDYAKDPFTQKSIDLSQLTRPSNHS